jgi:AcrR family transcriptional regulator
VGLRERNAAHTREAILDAAYALFAQRGYDATRMEEIAERAEIGTSTLYRYFPTKDELVIGPLALRGQMAEELLARPADEPLDVALGHALVAILTTPRPDNDRIRMLSALVDSSPALQSRLIAEAERERDQLALAISTWRGRPADDLHSLLTARLALVFLEHVATGLLESAAPDNESAVREAVAALRDVLDAAVREPPTLPRMA